MPRDTWNTPGLTRLDLGEALRSKKKELLLGVGLAVVVIAAIIISVYAFFQPPKLRTRYYKFECPECKTRFDVKDVDLGDPDHLKLLYTVKCPNCGHQFRTHDMVRCINPECREWYNPPEEGISLCPKCHADESGRIHPEGGP